ncbi:membrane dipeptidase, partial [Pseudomonas sp. SIMBA_059]
GIEGWQNAGEARNVTAELISRGYSEADIAKLWGGNFLRVWEQVQRAAQPVATSSP